MMTHKLPSDIAAAINALDEAAQEVGNVVLSATDDELSKLLLTKYRARKALASAIAAHLGCGDPISPSIQTED